MNSILRCLSSKYRFTKKNEEWKSIEIAGFPVEILHGSVSQSSLPSPVAGTQCIACVVTAVSLSAIRSASTWNSEIVDDVVRVATIRHEQCEDKDFRGFADVSSFLRYTEVPGYEGRVTLKEELTCNGSMTQNPEKSLIIPPAVDIISNFIARSWDSVVTLNEFSIGVNVGQGFCYLFNSHPCDSVGKASSIGSACVIKIPLANAAEVVEYICSTNYGPTNISQQNLQSCVYCIVGISKKAIASPDSGSLTMKDTLESEQTPTEAVDSDDSELHFDLGKSKLATKGPSPGGASVSNKFDKIPEGFRVYKFASLPSRYDLVTQWFRHLDVKLISTTCVPNNIIKDKLIVVYSAGAMQTSEDFYWRKDGFSWKPGPHNLLPREKPTYKITYHYLRTDMDCVKMTRIEVSPLALKDGRHNWDELKRHEWPVILVNYKGHGSIDQVHCMPHGNRKYTPQKRSTKRALELMTNTPTTPEFQREYRLLPNEPKSKLLRVELRRKLQFTDTPYQTFAVQRSESESMDPVSAKLLKPRNVDQVKSVKSAMKQERSFKDPVQLLVHHSMLHKDLLPIYSREDGKLHVVAALPPLDSHFQDYLTAMKNVIFHYDTTFNCGDFYVSILAFRHNFLQDSPVVPLRFLFHETKSSSAHEALFKNLLKTFPVLKKSKVVLVTDREATFKTVRQQILPSAVHIFCHLHIYRNAEEWCKNHGQCAKSTQYCSDIRRLLHSKTPGNYDDLLETLSENWSASFLQYFNSRLKGDVEMSAKFAVQDKIFFDNNSGVTSNASESANAAYKQWLSGRKSMYEAVLRAYFYQTAKYGDIVDAFNGEDSKFKVNRQKNIPEFAFKPAADIVAELGLISIFGEGKFSNNVTEFKPENVEIKCTMGLAWWLVRNRRIEYIDQDCFVRGFNRRTFHVDVARKFCTCLEPSCCHLQAVLIQQRRPVSSTDRKLNLTKTSKLYLPLNRAGKKLSDKVRKRGRLYIQAKRSIELVKKAKSAVCKKLNMPSSSTDGNEFESSHKNNNDLCEEHHDTTDVPISNNESNVVYSMSDMEIELPQVAAKECTMQEVLATMPSIVNISKMTQLPLLSARNALEVVLNVQSHTVTLQDLKSLDGDIKRSEEAAIKKLNKGFQRGNISDAVVNAFIARIMNTKMAFVPSEFSLLAAENGTSKKLGPALESLKNDFWSEINLVFLPFMTTSKVWKLGVVQVTTEGVTIYVVDPRNPHELDENSAKHFHSFISILKPMPEKFQVKPPMWKLPQQLNSTCSGVLVCMFALSFAKEFSMASSVSLLEMRHLILSVLCGQCAIKCRKDRLICSVCGVKCLDELAVSCKSCHQRSHFSCLDTPTDLPFSEKFVACGTYKGKLQ